MIEDVEKADLNPATEEKAPRRAGVSREFVWVVSVILAIGLGMLGFRGFQYLQTQADLNFVGNFVRTNMEAATSPNIEPLGVRRRVAAFLGEEGPVQTMPSSVIESRGELPQGEPTYVTKCQVQTAKGKSVLHIKVKNQDGTRTVISVTYEPDDL